ncbi:hypothetical protein FSARC_4599 [Fusarium sarcochroum]|uniref:Protein kinase domain-containing protein n=1 Tax=Fusarium sarcochroum TaxID=1208366 RepID=A0A8H4U1C9_9HYPO|nr:hypothetical protein FSARC_4599 [Fusarium sarcochroum]
MDPNSATLLAATTRRCLSTFDVLISSLRGSPDDHGKNMPPKTLSNQKDRLKIWADNLGAFQHGNASLDFQLQGLASMKMAINRDLEQLIQILTSNCTRAKATLRDLLDGEEELWESSSDSSFGLEVKNYSETELAQSVLRTLPHDEIAQVDDATKANHPDSYTQFDRAIVQKFFGDWSRAIPGGHVRDLEESNEAGKYPMERWSRSITNRCRFFAYWRKVAEISAKEQEKVTTESLRVSKDQAQRPDFISDPAMSTQSGYERDTPSVARTLTSFVTSKLTRDPGIAQKLSVEPDTLSTVSYTSTADGIDDSTSALLPAPQVPGGKHEFQYHLAYHQETLASFAARNLQPDEVEPEDFLTDRNQDLMPGPIIPNIEINDTPLDFPSLAESQTIGPTGTGPAIQYDDRNTTLYDLLWKCKVPHVDPKQDFFWSYALLKRTITPDRVCQALESTGMTSHDSRKCCEHILGRSDTSGLVPSKMYLRIFAILVLQTRTKDIMAFIQRGLCDDILCLRDFETRPSAKECFEALVWMPHEIDYFTWSRRRVSVQFFDLGPDGHAQNYKIPNDKILPWVRCDALDKDQHTYGGFGKVRKYKIDSDSHGFSQILESASCLFLLPLVLIANNQFAQVGLCSQLVAIKSLKKPIGEIPGIPSHKEFGMLKRFSGKDHPSLITLLATYTLGGYFHFIFPAAECDLDEYWEREMGPLTNTNAINIEYLCWLSGQVQGLFEALNFIHKRNQTHLETSDRYVRHGDLKPENILWFKSPVSSRGIFVITDLEITDAYTDRTKSNIPNHSAYRPPECDIDGYRRSRAYDVWTMGCVLLEMACWLLGGNKEIEKFRTARTSTYVTLVKTDILFDIKLVNDGQGYGVTVKKEVIQWINRLHELRTSTPYIHELLDLVHKYMLVIELEKRLPVSDLLRKVTSMHAKTSNESYVARPQPEKRPTVFEEPIPVKLGESLAYTLHEQGIQRRILGETAAKNDWLILDPDSAPIRTVISYQFCQGTRGYTHNFLLTYTWIFDAIRDRVRKQQSFRDIKPLPSHRLDCLENQSALFAIGGMDWAQDNFGISENGYGSVFEYVPRESTVIKMLASDQNGATVTSLKSDREWFDFCEVNWQDKKYLSAKVPSKSNLQKADVFAILSDKSQITGNTTRAAYTPRRRGIRTLPFSQEAFRCITRAFYTHGSIAKVISRSDIPVFSYEETIMEEPAYGKSSRQYMQDQGILTFIPVYNLRTSNAWEGDQAMSATFFPRANLTFAIVYGCSLSVEKEIMSRLSLVKQTQIHPLLIPAILTELEMSRHADLVKSQMIKLELRILESRFNPDDLEAPIRIDVGKQNEAKRSALLDTAYLKNGLVTWITQIGKMAQHIQELEEDQNSSLQLGNRPTNECSHDEKEISGEAHSHQKAEILEGRSTTKAFSYKQQHSRRTDTKNPKPQTVMGKKIGVRLRTIQDEYKDWVRDCEMRVDGLALAARYTEGETNVEIALSTRQDSRYMRSIALVTMIFLPGTWLAGVFSMTFFEWNSDAGGASVSGYVWIYAVATLVLTTLTVGCWYFVTVYRPRHLAKGFCKDE